MKSLKHFKTSILLLFVIILTASAPAAGSQLEWATYYGDKDYQDTAAAEAVAVAPDGSVVAVGFILSLFPTAPLFSVDAFIVQFSSDGTTLINELVLPGSPINGAFGVSVDASGITTVTGQTYSPDFPVTDDALQDTIAGDADGFLIQLSPDFEIIYATYLGGSGEECIVDMTVDKKGGFVVCGYTASEDFPVTDGAFQDTSGGAFDAFVSRIVPGGENQLTYSTYLGGSGDDCDGDIQDERLLRQAVAITPSGNIVVAGMTWSDDFPVTDGAYEYSPLVPAEVDIAPKTLNLNSKGKWITAFIWLPEEYNTADIEPNSVYLEGEIEPERFCLTEDQQVAIAKFDREQVQNILSVGEVELTITGQLTDGTIFEGTDIIKVTDKADKKKK